MGYRSDIIIGVTKTVVARDLLTDEIPKCLKTIKYITDENSFAVYWEINQWKWYDSSPDVAAITSWLKSLDQEEYGFIRLGEDDEDIEIRGSPTDFEMYLQKSIDFPFG